VKPAWIALGFVLVSAAVYFWLLGSALIRAISRELGWMQMDGDEPVVFGPPNRVVRGRGRRVGIRQGLPLLVAEDFDEDFQPDPEKDAEDMAILAEFEGLRKEANRLGGIE
jgi:hypothetical protein